MKRIIFVCTGNTCRSPMAEALAKSLFDKNIEIISRGLLVSFPSPANEKALYALKEYDLGLDNHTAKPLSKQDLNKDTLVLTMTSQHKEYLKMQYPMYLDRIFTLNEFVEVIGDINDPYGQAQEIYNECANTIYESVKKLKIKLQNMEV